MYLDLARAAERVAVDGALARGGGADAGQRRGFGQALART